MERTPPKTFLQWFNAPAADRHRSRPAQLVCSGPMDQPTDTRNPARTPEGKVDLAAPPPKMANDKPDCSGWWAFRGAGGGISQLKPTEIRPWAEALHKQRDEELQTGAQP